MHIERTEQYKVTPEQLWPLIANTDSLNRELGLPAVSYTFHPQPRGGSAVRGKMKVSGIQLEWDEHPFEWIYPSFLSVRRVYIKGPFREFRCRWSLAPENGGTRLTITADMESDGLTGKAIAALAARKPIDQMFDAAKNFEKFILKESTTAYPNRYGKADVDDAALDEALKRLLEKPVDKALAKRLAKYVADEVDEKVRNIRPFALADAWGVDRYPVLTTCLQATRAGLLELRWHVICPRCKGSKGENDTMKKLATQHECKFCAIKFQVDLDQRVEARFTPNGAIRRVGGESWCMGGPMNTPHIYAQFDLKAGEARAADIAIPKGRYEIRHPASTAPVSLKVGSGAAEAQVNVGADAPGEPVSVERPGRLVLRNLLDADLRVAVELEADEKSSATAAVVTSLQEFRDLYATEALAEGVELAIGSLSIFFSDLKGSTAMYEKIGDAPAYAVVRRHFEFMMERIRRHNGGIVKTMGDAVMAVFRHPADAVLCALTVQRESKREDVGVKIGIHYGPCLAVTSVDYLDYFGSTVNIAQRTQSQSMGGDVVISEAVLNSPGVAAAIEKMGAHESSFRATLKGFENQFILHRLVFGMPGQTTFYGPRKMQSP